MTNKFQALTNCPSCGTSLVQSATGIDLFCPNTEGCPEQIKLRLSYFCQRNIGNITGLSEKQIERFIKEFKIQTIADLFDLPWYIIREFEGFGEKSVQNLQESIAKTLDGINDYRFLAGLSIEGVGIEVAKLICGMVKKD
jgi:DNA ligase (NAD+)